MLIIMKFFLNLKTNILSVGSPMTATLTSCPQRICEPAVWIHSGNFSKNATSSSLSTKAG